MNIEFYNLLDEALTLQQRRKRAVAARRNKNRLKIARARKLKRAPDAGTLINRARKAARRYLIKQRTRGVDKSQLPPAKRNELEKWLDQPAMKMRINRLAMKMIAVVRKIDRERRQHSQHPA